MTMTNDELQAKVKDFQNTAEWDDESTMVLLLNFIQDHELADELFGMLDDLIKDNRRRNDDGLCRPEEGIHCDGCECES